MGFSFGVFFIYYFWTFGGLQNGLPSHFWESTVVFFLFWLTVAPYPEEGILRREISGNSGIPPKNPQGWWTRGKAALVGTPVLYMVGNPKTETERETLGELKKEYI